MFERPTKTLKRSLFTVLKHAQEYVADVCFEYPDAKVWAHRALLIARVPKDFRQKYMPQLDSVSADAKVEPLLTINLSVVIPHTVLRRLLRFWYFADFYDPVDDPALLSSDLSSLSISDNSSVTSERDASLIRQDIKLLEDKLGTSLLSKTTYTGPLADVDQWVDDLKRMLDDRISCDVVVNIFNVPNSSQNNQQHQQQQQQQQQDTPLSSFPAHRFILASQSPYFYAVFCAEFREASTSSVHMPSDLFSYSTLQVILHYFYTDKLIIPPLEYNGKKSQPHIARLNEKKHELRILQRVFAAADFLGHSDTICKAAVLKMAVTCHQFKCVCNDCAALLPSMLLFADRNEKYVPKLRSKILSLYADPLDSLAPLWSQKPFAILINSLTSIATTQIPTHRLNNNSNNIKASNGTQPNVDSGMDGTQVISKIFSNKAASPSSPPPPVASPMPANTMDSTHSLSSSSTTTASIIAPSGLGLIEDLTERTFSNITKNNAVRALHSLHLCLSYLRGADPFPSWSQPVLNILNQFLDYTVDMISSNFDYYCVEYPILLSCVDGIGFGFSVDFLGFVLNRVLTEGIHDGNAAILYQGIVRDLGGRQEMVRNVAVDGVLMDSRAKCAQYISRRWMAIKAENGFATVEKEILRLIAEDINVPTKALTKPLESDFSTMFSFKPKKSFSSNASKALSKEDAVPSTSVSNASKRLSLGSNLNIIQPQENVQDSNGGRRPQRTRSLSASNNNNQESILRKDTQYRVNDHHSDTEDMMGGARRRSVTAAAAAAAVNTNSGNIHYRFHRRQGSTGSLTDALLPIDIPPSKEGNQATDNNKAATDEPAPRPTRLRFALPDTPSRVKPGQQRLSAIQGSNHSGGLNHAQKAAARKSRRAKSPGKSRWSLGYSTSDSSDDESGSNYKHIPLVGQKVELLRRPLPTLGTIKYIGDVEFAKGTWVGVELESRLGNNDGSVDGKRYFETFPQRGVFVKIDDFKIIAPPAEKK